MSSGDISVDEYHQRSKHSLQKYAAGPDGLDWDAQPDPFRRFDGCARFALPLPAKNLIVDFNELYHQETITPAILDRNTLGALFELSLGLSAWKVYGSQRWALRVNPSSGNLHPTEAYLLFAGSNIIPAGLYHYHSHDHCLEQRCNLKTDAGAVATLLGEDRALIGLSSIHWREAWKYGERAFRYCQLDVGHAIAALRYAASMLGWRLELLNQYSDQQVAGVLGLSHDDSFTEAEPEAPDVLLLLDTANKNAPAPDINKLIELLNRAQWKGQANCLSPNNSLDWQVIEKVARTCESPETESQNWSAPDYPKLPKCNSDIDASSIIRHRRSAQAFDAETVMPLTTFYRMLDCLLPRADTAPFDSIHWQPRLHLVLYVHRVEGLKPGLYILPRTDAAKDRLQQSLRDEFDWSRPPICPESLPLYHLVSASSQNAARTLSCHQEIASDGAFAVSMLAEYEQHITNNPWLYKQLYWEAGMIGQVLYLEAEAATLRATGIGCFFDDAVHETLGIKDKEFQVLYHLTVGKPMLDIRLISLPPYRHLK